MPISLSISSPATSNFDLLRFLLVSLEVAVACANRFDWFDCESVLTEHDATPSSEVLTERLEEEFSIISGSIVLLAILL